VTHTGVLRNPKWISLSPLYSCARVKTSRMCRVIFSSPTATKLLNGPPHFRSGIFLFRGSHTGKRRRRKKELMSLCITWRTLMDHSFCNRSLHPPGEGSSSVKESEKKQHFLSLLIIREIWRGRSYKCDVIRAHGDYIPFGNVFLGRRQKCTQKRFR
jgi:hypothetical protein